MAADRDVVVLVEDAVRAAADHLRRRGSRRTPRSAAGAAWRAATGARWRRSGSRRCSWSRARVTRSSIMSRISRTSSIGLPGRVGDVPVVDAWWGRRGRRRRSPSSPPSRRAAASRPSAAWACRPARSIPTSRITSTTSGHTCRAGSEPADSRADSRRARRARRTLGPSASARRCGCTRTARTSSLPSPVVRRPRPASSAYSPGSPAAATSRATASAS